MDATGSARETGSTADGVFSGGGIKGLAFAGALKATEEAGYDRWHELAGTSAGAITAMALAAGYNAETLNASLEAFDFGRIADYGTRIPLVGEIENLLLHRSLVRGDALTEWIQTLLRESDDVAEDATFGQLEAATGRRLIVVGTDLAHGRIVTFPDEVALYRDDQDEPLEPAAFPVAKAVRISAGYPYFFPPIGGMWDRQTGREAVFVDGGVGSSLPLYVFDKPEPQHPTWGFHLHGGRDASETQPAEHKIGGPTWSLEMLEAVLDTAMNALDKFELHRFPGRVIPIPTGAVSTLNFNLTKTEKEELYNSGFDAAEGFFAQQPAPENTFGKVPPGFGPGSSGTAGAAAGGDAGAAAH